MRLTIGEVELLRSKVSHYASSEVRSWLPERFQAAVANLELIVQAPVPSELHGQLFERLFDRVIPPLSFLLDQQLERTYLWGWTVAEIISAFEPFMKKLVALLAPNTACDDSDFGTWLTHGPEWRLGHAKYVLSAEQLISKTNAQRDATNGRNNHSHQASAYGELAWLTTVVALLEAADSVAARLERSVEAGLRDRTRQTRLQTGRPRHLRTRGKSPLNASGALTARAYDMDGPDVVAFDDDVWLRAVGYRDDCDVVAWLIAQIEAWPSDRKPKRAIVVGWPPSRLDPDLFDCITQLAASTPIELIVRAPGLRARPSPMAAEITTPQRSNDVDIGAIIGLVRPSIAAAIRGETDSSQVLAALVGAESTLTEAAGAAEAQRSANALPRLKRRLWLHHISNVPHPPPTLQELVNRSDPEDEATRYLALSGVHAGFDLGVVIDSRRMEESTCRAWARLAAQEFGASGCSLSVVLVGGPLLKNFPAVTIRKSKVERDRKPTLAPSARGLSLERPSKSPLVSKGDVVYAWALCLTNALNALPEADEETEEAIKELWGEITSALDQDLPKPPETEQLQDAVASIQRASPALGFAASDLLALAWPGPGKSRELILLMAIFLGVGEVGLALRTSPSAVSQGAYGVLGTLIALDIALDDRRSKLFKKLRARRLSILEAALDRAWRTHLSALPSSLRPLRNAGKEALLLNTLSQDAFNVLIKTGFSGAELRRKLCCEIARSAPNDKPAAWFMFLAEPPDKESISILLGREDRVRWILGLVTGEEHRRLAADERTRELRAVCRHEFTIET